MVSAGERYFFTSGFGLHLVSTSFSLLTEHRQEGRCQLFLTITQVPTIKVLQIQMFLQTTDCEAVITVAILS